ncbi:MAG TPA: hypothetical protein VEY94_10875 [Patescibacteria group bacterium]|nr:hypothetical protein [Patescibacteria group bacterium]
MASWVAVAAPVRSVANQYVAMYPAKSAMKLISSSARASHGNAS